MAHLDALSGGLEPRFLPVEPSEQGAKGVVAITYDALPEPGFITAITYGLSLADHAEWRFGKPELCVSVRSADDRWAWAIAAMANKLRGQCPFSYQDTINFGEVIAPGSTMTAFVIFAPAVLKRESYTNIDVGDSLPIHISGAYPIHDDERHWIQQHGLEAFWKLNWDPYDITRASAIGAT